jgi:hypothetical protein
MPRRVYTYIPETGWGGLNLLSSLGAALFFASFVVLLANAWISLRRGQPAGDNPWGASTLEWATTSPPPPHNFDRIPLVTSRDPLWAERDGLGAATGLAVGYRELLVTTVTHARPDLRESSPQPTIWPLIAALAVGATFIGSIFTPWAVLWGAPPITVALIGWFWPKGSKEDEE